MPYLTRFTVQNFKAFRESAEAPIRPLTLLFGPNSAGKSSYLQALHLYADLLVNQGLHPAGLALGNWLHGRERGRTVHLEAEVHLLPTDHVTSSELGEDTSSVALAVELGLEEEDEFNSWSPLKPVLKSVEVSVNGVPSVQFHGETLLEQGSGQPVSWTGLELESVDWALPGLRQQVETTRNRLLRALNIPEEHQSSVLKTELQELIHEAWLTNLTVSTSDFLRGRAGLLRTSYEVIPVTAAESDITHHPRLTYERVVGETAFIAHVIHMGSEHLQSIYRAIKLDSDEAMLGPNNIGSKMNSILEKAFQKDYDGLFKVLSLDETLSSEDLIEFGERLPEILESWQTIKEISQLLAFGLEDVIHLLHQYLQPVVQVMTSFLHVGPVRELGEKATSSPDAWISLLTPPTTRRLVNRWLTQLQLNYEVVQTHLIAMDYLEAATTKARKSAEFETAEKLILMLDEAMLPAGLSEEQADHLRQLLRQRVQQELLEDAIGLNVDRPKGMQSLTNKARFKPIGGYSKPQGLSSMLRTHISAWFPESRIPYADWERRLTMRALKRAAFENQLPTLPSTQPKLTLLKLRDKRTGLLLDDTELGVGISQLLPVLARAATPGLVVIEQPELHVHPALQADLADLLIEAANQHGATLILETHSEHLILRVLRRIRETSEQSVQNEALRLTPQDVSVLYVEPGQAESGATVKVLPITSDGELDGRWPKGFFADRSEDLL